MMWVGKRNVRFGLPVIQELPKKIPENEYLLPSGFPGSAEDIGRAAQVAKPNSAEYARANQEDQIAGMRHLSTVRLLC